jgi:glycosyltransferase involved in cell wall biosynthesis
MRRILYLDDVSEIAGGANSLIRLITHLDQTRFTPIVLCPPGPLANRMIRHGVEHIPFTFRMQRLKTGHPTHSKVRVLNPLALVQRAFEGLTIARIVRDYNIDLLHTNSLLPHIAGVLAAKLTSTPIIWHIRLFLPRLLYRFILPTRIVFVSDAVRRNAFPSGPPPTALVIYNGEDLSALQPGESRADIRAEFGIGPGQPLVAIIGRLTPIKGQRELLLAWRYVVDDYPQARLMIVGSSITLSGQGYLGVLQEVAQDLQIKDSVIFTGFRSDVPDILEAVDVFVSFTLNDANPRSVLEAMAMGKAIVGARSGGVPEMIVEGESGLLVNRDDIPGLASAIKQLIADADLRRSMGMAARRRAVEKFTLEMHVDRVQSLYDEILTGR